MTTIILLAPKKDVIGERREAWDPPLLYIQPSSQQKGTRSSYALSPRAVSIRERLVTPSFPKSASAFCCACFHGVMVLLNSFPPCRGSCNSLLPPSFPGPNSNQPLCRMRSRLRLTVDFSR